MAWPVATRATDDLITAAIWNADIAANMNSLPHLIARKTSDQSFTNTTLTDVTSLVFPVAANEIWRFTMIVIYFAGTTGDIKFGWTFPTGGRLNAGVVGYDTALATIYRQWNETTSPSTTISLGGSGSSIRATITVEGVFATSSTAGNVQLQAAEDQSDATASVIYTNSTLWGVKLA